MRVRVRTSGGGIFGSIVALIFLGVFTAFIVFFLVSFSGGFIEALQPYKWKPVQGVILSSEVIEEPQNVQSPYTVQIAYRYAWEDGQEYRNESKTQYNSYTEAQEVSARYAPAAPHTCYVNPKNPSEAVLKRPSLWGLLFLLIPGIFILIIILIFRSILRSLFGRKRSPEQIESISEKKKHGSGVWFIFFFFSIFFLFGFPFFYFLFLKPAFNIMIAKSWREVPCEIHSSQLLSSSDSDGTTYRISILYSYEFEGKTYKSDRYDFSVGYSSGYDRKAAAVAKHPVGSEGICYVNPQNPAEAVMAPYFTTEIWLSSLTSIFMLVGLAGMIGALYKLLKKKPEPQPDWVMQSQQTTSSGLAYRSGYESSADTVLLKTSASPIGKFLAVCFFSLIWNGITGVFVFFVARGWVEGNPSWGLTLFMIPFVLVGLGLIVGMGYSFLALFNPRPVLSMKPGRVYPGDTVTVYWEFPGRASAVKNLHVYIEGVEQARYRRGTDTYTDNFTFARIEGIETFDAYTIKSGSAVFRIPEPTAPSFSGGNNKFIWKLHFRGEIANYPDVIDEFEIQIYPVPVERLTHE